MSPKRVIKTGEKVFGYYLIVVFLFWVFPSLFIGSLFLNLDTPLENIGLGLSFCLGIGLPIWMCVRFFKGSFIAKLFFLAVYGILFVVHICVGILGLCSTFFLSGSIFLVTAICVFIPALFIVYRSQQNSIKPLQKAVVSNTIKRSGILWFHLVMSFFLVSPLTIAVAYVDGYLHGGFPTSGPTPIVGAFFNAFLLVVAVLVVVVGTLGLPKICLCVFSLEKHLNAQIALKRYFIVEIIIWAFLCLVIGVVFFESFGFFVILGSLVSFGLSLASFLLIKKHIPVKSARNSIQRKAKQKSFIRKVKRFFGTSVVEALYCLI